MHVKGFYNWLCGNDRANGSLKVAYQVCVREPARFMYLKGLEKDVGKNAP